MSGMTTIKSTPLSDPNLTLPPAVRARAERAAALHQQTYAPAEAAVEGAEVNPPDPAPEQVPAPVAPAPVAPAPAPQEPTGGWEHAFRSVNARYTRSVEDNRLMAERLRSMDAQLAELKAAPAAPAPAPESMITADEVETFGADFLGVVGKKAKEIFSPEVAALRAQVDRLTNQLQGVGQTVAKDARTKMKEYMTQNLSNWVQVNDHPEFLDWLALPDPMSGAIRHNMLKDAWGRNEAARVLAIFNGFLASNEATVAPATPPKPADQVPLNERKPGKVPLETFAAPGRAKPSADPTKGAPVDEKRIITRAEITKHYADSAAGKYRGREAEYQSFERGIEAAQRDGRIR